MESNQKESRKEKVLVIGAGFGGLGAAGCFVKAGHEVIVLEKNNNVGGRNNVFQEKGYTFDMGPSWFMLLDVWGHWFELMGEDMHDHLDIVRLDPSYRFINKDSKWPVIDVPADKEAAMRLFESIESGAGEKLQGYIDNAEFKYGVGYERFMYKNFDSVFDFLNWEVMTKGLRVGIFKNLQKHIESHFKTPELHKLLQWAAVLLGSNPKNMPGVYSLMTHADMNDGIWYPMGGMYKISEAVADVAKKNGVEIQVNREVKKILTKNGEVAGVLLTNGDVIDADVVVSNAELPHTELKLLDPRDRSYSEKYFENLEYSLSGFVMYIGIDGKADNLTHHNFISEPDWDTYLDEVFVNKKWPTNPTPYVCVPSRIDPDVAPEGKELLFVLMPIAADLEDTPELRDQYAEVILSILENDAGIKNIRNRVEVLKTYCSNDLRQDYHAYKGNALGGPTQILSQTAAFRSNNVSKKIKNLYYAGSSMHPGLGTMIALISGQNVYKRHAGIKHPYPMKPDEL